jgi:hypothetical protein
VLANFVSLAAILLGSGIIYRIATDKGELVMDTQDSNNIEVIVKQGGKRVTIVDPKTDIRIALDAGRYEFQLASDKRTLKLSSEAFRLKRSDKTVVTVRREVLPRLPASQKPAAGRRADADLELIQASQLAILSKGGSRGTLLFADPAPLRPVSRE